MAELNPVLKRFYDATNTSTVAELADFLGIRRQAIYAALKNDSIPKDWYFKIAEKLDCSIDWLAHGEGPKERASRIGSASTLGLDELADEICEKIVGASGSSEAKQRCVIDFCEIIDSWKETRRNAGQDLFREKTIKSIQDYVSKLEANAS